MTEPNPARWDWDTVPILEVQCGDWPPPDYRPPNADTPRGMLLNESWRDDQQAREHQGLAAKTRKAAARSDAAASDCYRRSAASRQAAMVLDMGAPE